MVRDAFVRQPVDKYAGKGRLYVVAGDRMICTIDLESAEELENKQGNHCGYPAFRIRCDVGESESTARQRFIEIYRLNHLMAALFWESVVQGPSFLDISNH